MPIVYSISVRSVLVILILATISCLLLISLVIRLITTAGNRTRYSLLQIDNMTGLEFEHYLVLILKTQGYKQIRLTEKYDLGIDIVASKHDVIWGIQAKRYKGLVGVSAIRQVVAALNIYNCDQAMVITNSFFTVQAIKLAKSNNCKLVDRAKLAQMNNCLLAPSLDS